MTDSKELDRLIEKAIAKGAGVKVVRGDGGVYESIQVSNARGIGPHPMGPIAAAERLREFVSAQ